jgi:hypothetical protein
MSNRRDTTSGYATVGIACEIFSTHRSPEPDKGGVTPRGRYLEEAVGEEIILKIKRVRCMCYEKRTSEVKVR